MKWWERNLWLVLAAIVIIVAWQLTRLITHVDRTPRAPLTLTIDQGPIARQVQLPLSVEALQTSLHRLAGAAMVNPARILLIITPTTRSVAVSGIGSAVASCAFVAARGGVTALLVGAEPSASRVPIDVAQGNGDLHVPISTSIDRLVASTVHAQGGVECTLSHPLSTAPTFTERSVTVRSGTPATPILIDVSALDDIDDLRFSGGVQLPFGGERVRLLYGGNDTLSAEWSDVNAQEKRDIVLVLIGALSAIAAATIIEAIRPSIESRSKAPGDTPD
jgi:hypothetical protein